MRYPHIEFEREKISQIATQQFILDVGGGARFTKWLRKYEHLFNPKSYKTFDYDSKTNPDIVGDIHAMPIKDSSVDAIICASVLEHVRDPRQAIFEMFRILKPGGEIFVYVPSTYPYHARKDHYPDYWRFFDDTLRDLFESWTDVELVKVGGYFKALSFFVPFQHKLQWFLRPTAHLLDTFFNTDAKTTTSGYMLYAKKP